MVAGARSVVVYSANRLHGSVGGLISLLPFTVGRRGSHRGDAVGVGRCPHPPGFVMGVSNEFLLPVASVRVETGTLLAVMATE